MKIIKKIISVLIVSVMTMTVFSGCKKQEAGIPTLNWYLFFAEQNDLPLVQAELNKITEKNLGCRVNIVRIEEGDYNEKIKLGLAGGEAIDICHMAPRFNFYSHLTRGAFLALDELIEKNAPDMYDIMPERFWDAPRVDGKLYGIPNYQIVGRMNGFVCLKELTEKYNFDLSKVEKLEDMEPYYKAVKAGESSNMRCFNGANGAYSWGMSHFIGFDAIGSEKYPCAVRTNDDSLTVVNQYETEEFENYCRLMRKWYNNGYIPKLGSNDSSADLLKQGLVASNLDNIAPGFITKLEKQRNGRAVDTKVIDPPFVNTANIIATMNCVVATTKYPELCVKFLNMVNHNVDNVYNLLCYGIEGKHYNKINDNRVETIKDSGYEPNKSWEFGNNFNAYLIEGQEDDIWEQTKHINETAVVSKLLGFSLNTESIKGEIEACNAVIEEYMYNLTSGAIDIDTKLPEFQRKLKEAGSDRIISDVQKQIDDWKIAR